MSNLLDAADNPLIQRLGWTLLHFVWQGTVLGLCVGVGLLLLRRSASATRYNLLLTVFGLMALAPVVTFFIVTPTVAVTPSPPPETSQAVHVPARQPTVPAGIATTEFPELPAPWPTPLPENSSDVGDASDRAVIELPAARANRPVRSLAERARPFLPWLVAGWLLGVVLLSLRLIGAWRRIQRLVGHSAGELNLRWRQVADQLLAVMQIRRTVRFLESQQAVVPVVIGWLKPVVVVPTSILTNLTFDEAEALLAHELAHVKRCDELVNLLQTVFETLFFYHPAVWFVSSRLRQEREHCCDDLAAEVVGDRLAYSRALVAAAQLASEHPHRLAVAATGGNLRQRIQRLMEGVPPQRVKKRWPAIVVLSLAAFLAVGILACSGSREPTGMESATSEDRSGDEQADRWRAEIANMAAAADSVLEESVSAGPAAIAGRVLDPTGNPVDSARVYLLGEEQKLIVFQVGEENRPRLEGSGSQQMRSTDSNGRFSFGEGDDWNRIAVVADACPLWVLERSEIETLDSLEVQLPETGAISVIVDLPEEPETVELMIGLQSFDDRNWRRDQFLKNWHEVENPAETVISGLPPGFYSVERMDDLDFGTHGHVTDCERQIVWVSDERPAEVSFSRQFGVRVSGVVQGLDVDDFDHAVLTMFYDGPEEALLPDGRRTRMMTSFDSMKLERHGEFTTQPMPPGEYRFQVFTMLGDRTTGSPDLRGSAVVNVPATGEVGGVTIQMESVDPPVPDPNEDPDNDDEAAEPQPPDDPADGRVVRVGDETRTVWINLGVEDGLRPQVTFNVYTKSRDGGVNARIEVTRILGPHLAEARILEEDLQRPIAEDDLIDSPTWSAKWTPVSLKTGIERAMQQVLSVAYAAEYEEVRDGNAFRDGEPSLPFTGTGHYEYRSDGRRWFADETGFTHTIGSTEIQSTRETSGFDGEVHYSREDDIVTLGEDTLSAERRAPHNVFWEVGKNWSWLKSALESPSATVKDRPVIDGHECVAVVSQTSRAGGDTTFDYEIVISPEQAFLPISCVIRKNGELETTWTIEELAQTADGAWYPQTIVTEHAHPFPTKSMRLTITEFDVRNDFTDDDFAYRIPAGVDVVDYPGGMVYFNDPWWPELKTLLRERFDQPTPWLSPTDEMGSFCDGTIDGQPAPTIEASEWINGDPGNWVRPGREYTVLFFFGGRAISPTPKWLAGLTALEQKYGEGGLDLMGVVSSSAAEGATQTVREFGLTFPVAVAAESEKRGSYGKPHDAFGLQSYAGVFVIDPDGIVHVVNSPELEGAAQLQLEPLIQQLMGLPSEEFARPDTHLSRPQWDAVVEEWRRLRSSSTADASLSGRMTVDASQPAAIEFTDVDLTLAPMLRVVSGHTPYGHTQQIDEADSVTVACDANGRYAFQGLTRGTYRLTVIGSGVERQEQFVAVSAGDEQLTHDVALTLERQ